MISISTFLTKFSSQFSLGFLTKSLAVFTLLTISPISNFGSLPLFAQNTTQNTKNIELTSTNVPQNQPPFTYYFPYQTDGQNSKISVSLVNKIGDGFDFIPSESVDIFDSSFINKPNFSCVNFAPKNTKYPINLGIFNSKSLTDYPLRAGGFDSKTDAIGCIGMKIKVSPNAQIGDESQIIFTNNLSLDSQTQKFTQTGTLKIIAKTNSGNNSANSNNSNPKLETNNSSDNDLKNMKPPDLCSVLPVVDSPDSSIPCMPSVPGSQTKTRYSGQFIEFVYNENAKKYETITRQNVDYKDSVNQVGCYKLAKLDLNTFGCGTFLEDDIELFVVNYSFVFPMSKQDELRKFYQTQGFRMNEQSRGVQWQVEYYRFKGLDGNFGQWQSYTHDIDNAKSSSSNSQSSKFVDYKKAQWIKSEINNSSQIMKTPSNELPKIPQNSEMSNIVQ